MNENRSKDAWTGARGKKWLGQLARMEAMLAPIDEPLIRALHLDAACRIAEIGCGGGGTSLKLLRQAPAESLVHAFDVSPALIDVARGRGTTPGFLAFETADMATATPPNQPYDRLVSRFGVMFFADPPAAFANLLRWLVPAGSFAFAVWGSPAENPWMTVVREAVAEIVTLPSSDPDAPGPFRYGDVTCFLALLDQAGYADLEVNDWHGALQMGGGLAATEAADFALASFSSFAEMLAEAGEQARKDANEALAERLSTYEVHGAVRMEACAHIVTGAPALGGVASARKEDADAFQY